MFIVKVLLVVLAAAFVFAQTFDVSFESLSAYAAGTPRIVQP